MTRTMIKVQMDVGTKLLERLAFESRERPVWLRVAKLFDGTSDHLFHNADVVFDAHSIRFVGIEGRTPEQYLIQPGQCAPDAVLEDYTVLPCLIEAHAHMMLDGATIDSREREQYLQQPAE